MDASQPAQIPTGTWQRWFAIVLFILGILAALAATPFNGAGQFASICFTLAVSAFFWSIVLRYVSLIERKIDRVMSIAERPDEREADRR